MGATKLIATQDTKASVLVEDLVPQWNIGVGVQLSLRYFAVLGGAMKNVLVSAADAFLEDVISAPG